AIERLLRRGLVEEVAVSTPDQLWRSDGDRQIGLAITAAGRAALTSDDLAPDAHPLPVTASTPPTPTTKIATVLDLLQRQGGATLDDIMAATGWLPHTTRAALTGLRKKGHAIARDRRDDVSCYRITKAA
ncbi:MAG: DUF3489 domain-containing protein, partial [Sphingomonadaceae bacterium]